jgi:hypothetical protein
MFVIQTSAGKKDTNNTEMNHLCDYESGLTKKIKNIFPTANVGALGSAVQRKVYN